MSNDKMAELDNGDDASQEGVTTLVIPEDQAKAVIEFVARLQQEDVSGHMISQGMLGGLGGSFAAKTASKTGCTHIGTTVRGKIVTDTYCTDDDTVMG